MKSFIAGLALVGTVAAEARTSAPEGCVTVSASGGDFSTVQEAVDSDATCVFLAAGTYAEQVFVEERSAQFTIYGETDDTLSYAGNKATITSGKSQADGLNNDQTATLRVHSANFKLYNVNVDNSYGEGSQAVALSAQAASGYYGSAFTGFQDTVLANEGAQMYANSLIVGATDFIFGQRAPAWFEACDIQVVDKSLGYITGKQTETHPHLFISLTPAPPANGRNDESGTSYYVFNNANVGGEAPDGAYYLGRPWREHARVVFQNSELSAVINPEGWRIWNDGDERTDGVLFGEFGNTGPGAVTGARAEFATALDAAVAIEEVLGADYASAAYFDAAYL